MQARIYRPTRTAMQSGLAKTHHWVLEFAPGERRAIDPLMGWTGSGDTQRQVQLMFESLDEAKAYAAKHGIEAVVLGDHRRKPNIRKGGYGDNFATNRRGAWTH
jgi:hypothetical protein